MMTLVSLLAKEIGEVSVRKICYVGGRVTEVTVPRSVPLDVARGVAIILNCEVVWETVE